MVAILLSLACSTCFGMSDFLGGLMSRRHTLASVLVTAQLAAFAVCIAIALVLTGPLPDSGDCLLAMAGGCASMIGIGALYRALAVEAMGIIAPISACQVILPIVVGAAVLGEWPNGVQALGLLLTLGGVGAAIRLRGRAVAGGAPAAGVEQQDRVAGVGLAVVAAVAFGAGQLLLDKAAEGDVWWTVVLMRVGMVSTLFLAIAATRPQLRRPAPLAPVAAIGCFDLAAISFFTAATTEGLLPVVAVLSSVYPVVTIALARVVLDERLAAPQIASVAVALSGVAILAAA